MMVILLNCITLGMYQPCSDGECATSRCQVLVYFDHCIFAFFAAEMLIKMMAMGVWGKLTYLAETWNRLDCFIVLAGVAEYILSNTVEYAVDTENLSISAIRTIRVLRPLRAINRIPSMRILVMLLLDTLPMLGNVLLLCFFVFFIFGIIGVQLWAGVLRHRCYLDINMSLYHVPAEVLEQQYFKPWKSEYICAPPKEGGMRWCRDLPLYEYEGIRCNGSASMYSNNTPTNDSCVNWNQYYTDCRPGAVNPFKGAVSFDNIGLAWVVIFQVISLESWVNIMYYIQDAHSFWDWIYFVALIVIGSFFMINLCLVVIATQFSETKKRETERMMQERKRYQSCSTLASNSEPGGCYSELLKLLVHFARRAKRKMLQAYHRHVQSKKRQKINPERSISLRRKRTKKKGSLPTTYLQLPPSSHHQNPYPPKHHHHHPHHHHHYNLNVVTPDQYPSRADSSPIAPRASPEQSDVDPVSSPRRPNFLMVPSTYNSHNPSQESLCSLALGAVEALTPTLFKTQPTASNHLAVLMPSLGRASSFSSSVSGRALASLPEVLAAHGAKNAALAASNMLLNTESEPTKLQSVADKGLFADNLLMDIVVDKQLSTQFSIQSECETHPSHSEHDDNSEKEREDRSQSEPESDSEEESQRDRRRGPRNICELINQFQTYMRKFVESNFFQRSILLAILLNTLSMGVEYHNQPDTLTEILEYSNIVFCVLFTTEMGFKVLAYGLFGYISDGFNVFDGFIVILSMIELGQGGASGLSVLRTFRLLRILKLVRFMPALRRQLIVMLRTMDNVATFFALLVLFMFIFSILGMSVFGGRFCARPDGTHCTCEECRNGTHGCVSADRANFDSLLWSLVTVFQVLTQEDWNTVLYNGMHHTSNWASLYFIALMTFGNYVLFNLLVAILVEGFSTEDEDKKKEKQKEQEDFEKQEKEKERIRLAENNNIGDVHKEQNKITASDSLDLKNNKEKEKKMLALPPPVSITTSNENQGTQQSATLEHQSSLDGPVNPPIITHTAATPMGTPMATPQGSPNESALKDSNKLTVSVNMNRSSLSVETGDRSSASLSYRGSPRPSPRLYRSSSRGSQRSSWRLKNRRRNGDKTSLVVDSFSDSADDVDDDAFSSSQNSQSPTLYSPGVSPGIVNQSDCNGHLPLNNQRTLSPQNSVKGHRTLTPKNSIKSNHSGWSRNNSITSGRSICNSFELSRQNSFTSHRTLNSLGSGASKEEHARTKNLLDLPDVKVALDRDEGEEDEEDPDAIDETDWNCSWCPEPKGCFLERHEYALYILHMENPLRKVCHHLISRRWFDNTVLFFIALNCITLAMERPDIPPHSNERTFLTYANYMFTVVFALEMFIKVIAKGMIVGKHAYLKSGWNVMDGFLVIISLVDILVSLTANSSPRIFGILRVFRLLRTLRPLRVISRAPGLKLVVQTLLSSLRPIGNIVLICCTFFIIFGILGVQLFKGTFFYCKGPNVENVTNRTDCEADKKNLWINHKYNFDNLGLALMALFVLASKDGWVQIMYTGLDAVGVDQQPKENFNEWRLIYFIAFLLLVGFFVLNMFVGVVVENFHKCRESQEKEERAMRAAKRQGKLEKKRKKLREPPYWAHYSKPRLLIHTVINSKYFDLAIAGVIGLNVITMAMESYMMSAALEFALKIFNYFFTSVFILEAAMKIVSLGFVRYIRDRWNQLDIMIVILSIVGIVLEEMRTNVIPINPTIIRVMRVLRIARVLKLLKMAKGIRALLDTVIQALPQVGNLGLLFFLLFFIFAALGVELFGRLECSIDHPCVGLSEHAHFKNFGMAFLTLFRVATGDNWNGIMKDTLREDCDRSDNCLINCCVSPIIAPVYFVIFVLMAQFVLVNVVVAVLMKHLEETYKYKELDDEVEEELRQEMAAIEASRLEAIELKDAHHHVMEDDGTGSDPVDENDDCLDKLDDDANNDSDPKGVAENSDEMSQGDGDEDTDGVMGSVSNHPPSFTFSVRPPSEEQSHQSEDCSSLSPARIPITMETLSTPSNAMLSPGLLSPASLSQASLSPASLSPVSLSPNMLSPGSLSPSLSEPGMSFITSPPLSPVQRNPRLMHLRSESGARRQLTKQYSMDMGYDCNLHQPHHGSVPNVWQKFEQSKVGAELNKPKNPHGISQSQPMLADLLPKSDSLDSDPGQKTPRQRFKQRLLRSRSSGAKYSRFKDKYKREKSGEDNPAAQPMIDPNLRRSKERLRNSQCGSGETGSDLEDSLMSNWADEEAACDEEVKMITGEAAEDEDDVRPTLVSYASSDLDDPCTTSHSSSNVMPDSLNSSLDCDVFIHSSSQHPPAGLAVSHVQNPGQGANPISPLAKSPRLMRRGSSKKSRRHLTDPGIDNSSFELGEEVRTPKCDSLSRTSGSLKGRSASSVKTPVAPARSVLDSASPASVRQVTASRGSLPSPAAAQTRAVTPCGALPRSPLPGRMHLQAVAPSANPGHCLRLPVSGAGLASPQSPVPPGAQQRLAGSPPSLNRLHVCSISPHPHAPRPRSSLSVDCDSSTVPESHFSQPLSSSPVPPSLLSGADNPGLSGASSSFLSALPLPSSTTASSSSSSSSSSPYTQPVPSTEPGARRAERENLLLPVSNHPLQLSPIPPSRTSISPLPSPSNPAGCGRGSPKVRHRMLSASQSSDRELPDSNNTGPL
ncbi:hypothetical protein V1264_012439 [Littorina saxatilis]|uniref:Ion transport domain-containing protein n=1 Tax=Littorina saxatilis TaxID=31220 RepID=A0AAN9BXA5_9CAEN